MVQNAILQRLTVLLGIACVAGFQGCMDGGEDAIPYVHDDDTSVPIRDEDKPIEYDTEINSKASFNFDLSGLPFVGVNMSGAEWDGSASWPDQFLTRGYASWLKYFRGWGMTTVRLPFKWENLQPKLGEDFDEEELEALKITVFNLRDYRAKVLIDMHNYARYDNKLIGSDDVPYVDYADAWRRLAEIFKPYPEVMFGIMNEPHSMDTTQWVAGANAAIEAIRDTGAKNLIFINGNGWSGAHSWYQGWVDASSEHLTNAEAMLQVVDPLGDDFLIFEAHQYLNYDSSDWGVCECRDEHFSAGCTNETVGSFRMENFTRWLRENGKKGFVGEFGSYDDETCIKALDDMLNHIEDNDDVYVGWVWWSAGPGCAGWQDPIDPYCWKDSRVKDLEENGVDGDQVYGQVKLLYDHLN